MALNTKPLVHSTAFLALSTQYQILMTRNDKDGSGIGVKLVYYYYYY